VSNGDWLKVDFDTERHSLSFFKEEGLPLTHPASSVTDSEPANRRMKAARSIL
jgi:hypothetical protein